MAKVNISTSAPRKKARFHLPTTHLTTLSLASFRPINILPLKAQDKVDVNFSQVSQTNPTAVQTFGAFKIKTYAFFVPHRVVWKGYQNWRSSNVDASVKNQPLTFSLYQLYECIFGTNFNGSGTLYAEQIQQSTADIDGLPNKPICDFSIFVPRSSVNENSGTWHFLNLTAKGRALYNILIGLGYALPQEVSLSSVVVRPSGYTHTLLLTDFLMDALPLLSFGRFIYDYIFPSAYVNQQGFGYLFEDIDTENVESWLDKLLSLVFVPYESDFFTNLWLHPNSVGAHAGNQVDDIVVSTSFDNQNQHLVAFANNQDASVESPQISTSSSKVTFSASALRWLQSISDYAVRNQIGGQRFRDFLRSHFGFATAAQDCETSIFIKSFVDTINFSPVTASTGTDTQLLGERAGNGGSNGGGSLKFEAQEEGFLIFATMVVPSTAYYQGMKPWCEALTSKYDMYTPEIDSVGFEAIPRSRVYADYGADGTIFKVNPLTLRDVFGFAPRYADRYKVGHDYLSGDFRLRSRNKNAGAYHTYRDVLYNRNNLALDAQFLSADNQYERVFALNPTEEETQASMYDKIETLFLFDVTKWSYMLSISDSLPIFNKSGRDVDVAYNGNKL